MRFHTMIFRALLLVAGLVAIGTPTQGLGQRRVCYYTNWSQYRPGLGKFTPENVDPNLCTHYMYAFATLLGNRVKAFEWNDLSTQWMKGMYSRFTGMKRINPQIKALLAVGGWNLGSGPFHQMSKTQAHRQEFADSVVKFLRDNDFDGVDIDWEYPANRGSPPEDKQNFVDLLQTLRDAIEQEAQVSRKPKLMLTAAVAAGKSNIDTAYDIPALARLLDFISVMTYDLHGSWEDHTGHNSPLYTRAADKGDDQYLNLHWAAEYWVQKGAPRDKLNIGVALYGRTFTLSTSDHGLGAPANGPGTAGPYTREKGFLSYQEICEMERNGGTMVDIPEQRVRYIYRGDQWVGYDDELSLKQKTCYIKQHGFGGVMVWALDLDDFSGQDCDKGKYPLINTIITELETTDTSNCVGPGQPPQGVQTTPRPVHTTPRPTARPWTPNPPVHTTQRPVVTQAPVVTPRPVTNAPSYTTQFPHHTVGQTTDFTCNGRISDFYPSPFSCDEYFICANGMAFRVYCANGLIFNSITKYCDRPSNFQCRLPTGVVATPRPIVHTTTTMGPTISQGPLHQVTYNPTSGVNTVCYNKPNGMYNDPRACDKYIQCYMKLTFERKCDRNLAFNPQISACDYPYRVPGC